MCTVTFSPSERGFIFAMNRDEQTLRILALSPEKFSSGDQQLLYPREPNGGTWIGLSSGRTVLAVLNWHSAPYPLKSEATSRGMIIPQLLAAADSAALKSAVNHLPLDQLNPFRLIGVLGREREIHEWGWNGRHLHVVSWPWKLQHWFSSGYHEQEVQKIRAKTVEGSSKLRTAGTLAWIRELHSSHRPEKGAFSICMHRSDARTISYTEITVERNAATMNYCPNSPCSRTPYVSETLQLASFSR